MRTSRGTSTWCNIFVWDVTCAMGAEVPHYVDEAGRTERVGEGVEVTANATARWLETYGAAQGWREEGEREAARAAEAGMPALAVWHNTSGHGHVAVVVPGRNGKLHIAQAGASCVSTAEASGAWACRRIESRPTLGVNE